MKAMMPVILVAVMILTSLYGCQDENENELTEVSFTVQNPYSNGLKSTNLLPGPDDIVCQPYMASYVKTIIDGNEHKIAVFYVSGELYTQSLGLSPGEHDIQNFVLWYDNQTPDTEADDIPLSAGVHTGSPNATSVTVLLDYSFSIDTEKKKEIYMEVLCIDDKTASDFGFEWSRINTINKTYLHFFGDFCIKNAGDYQLSPYAQQTGWKSSGFIDVPAIAKIELWHKKDSGPWFLEETYTNSNQGEGITIAYNNKDNVMDSLIIKISVLVKTGQHYDFKKFFEIKLKDGERPLESQGSNHGLTTYYVIGECHDAANYKAPGYNCLPSQVSYKVGENYAPGLQGGYIDGILSNVPDGYEIGNGIYPFYCGDYTAHIQIGVEYIMNVYSSLYQEDLPSQFQGSKWNKINWLLNHIGLQGSQDWYPGHTWKQRQAAIWYLCGWDGSTIDGITGDATSQKMAADAVANYQDYSVPVGGWIILIFINEIGEVSIQAQLLWIDP